MVKIFLDAGHGGNDPGATGNGLREKDLTLDIAKRTRKYLNDNYVGYSIKLSRTNDKTLTLKQRTDMANKWGAKILISIHINAGGGTGYEDYIYNGNVSGNTSKYRDVIHAEIIKAIGNVRNRGKKRANFHMLRQSRMPAMLSESLFIDTKADADKLKSSAFLNRVAKSHAIGVAKALGLKVKPKPKPVVKPTQKADKGTFYRVVTGSYNDRKNADRQIAELKKAGFDSFIDVYKK